MNRTRLAVGIAIPVVLAIVLAFLFLRGDRPADNPTPVATAVPTTVATSTTQVPPPKATGEDWLAIMRDILTYRHQLYTNPQPNLLAQIYDQRCPCYAREHRMLSDLKARGLRYDDEGTEVLTAKLLARAKNKSSDVAVEVLVRTHTQILLNEAGQVVKRTPATNPSYQDYELLRGSDGRWRVLFELPVPSGRSKR